jgi:uncharacterized repeat protein (TIGR01451 family)
MGGIVQRAATISRPWRRAAAVTLLGVAGVLSTVPSAAAATSPDLAISVSSSASGALSVGDSFSYAIAVTNHGAGVAHDVRISDEFPVGVVPASSVPVLPGGSCSIASSQQSGAPPHTSLYCTRPTLPAGDAVAVDVVVHVTADVTCGSIVNATRTKADGEPSQATGDNAASVTDTVTCPPSIAIATRAPAYAHVGETVAITMVVTNDGAVDLGDVRVTNAACGGPLERVADGNGDATLDAHEAWRYRCTRRVTPGVGRRVPVVGFVTASDGARRVHASDRTTVRVLRPGLTIRVQPEQASGAVGETITYRFLVRNTGGSVLTGISVDDDHLGHIGDIEQLTPGHTATFRVDRSLRANDVWVVDQATATGADRSGRPVTATDTAAVTIVGHTRTQRGSDGIGTAFTGSRITWPATAGGVLVLFGACAIVLARRRTT